MSERCFGCDTVDPVGGLKPYGDQWTRDLCDLCIACDGGPGKGSTKQLFHALNVIRQEIAEVKNLASKALDMAAKAVEGTKSIESRLRSPTERML